MTGRVFAFMKSNLALADFLLPKHLRQPLYAGREVATVGAEGQVQLFGSGLLGGGGVKVRVIQRPEKLFIARV